MYSIRTLSDGDFLYDGGQRIEYLPSPNASGGFARKPRFLVVHYTAGSSGRSSARWFTNPAAKASAHLTIERDGTVIQSVPLSKRAWHAGRSAWRSRDGQTVSGLNSHSIGIELANAGACVRTASGTWKNPLGVTVGADDVMEARHRNGPVWFGGSLGNVMECGWELYPQAQMRSLIDVSLLLMSHYGMEEIVGHDDISPGRKTDPGPAFDMETFRGIVSGREDDGDQFWTVREDTPGGLAIRSGPGKENPLVQDRALAPGTRVAFNEAHGRWWFVTVVNDAGEAELDGWVYSRYLNAA
ncbi:N-acetylmuramoyl-L-alanine amidase [Poseidonocella pacifica]|uniref:N-acetylmuramoyl-L-alanine amidase n=1 Tax=Poseidonocella pacifica TaxID=871651 RepID=A0A1I0XAB4_9RHOB|nr:N-acetylmuramoyl-L-alanine amidase [Poseidonocella pacifica]SFA97607.1 N-acetylmuramoyl-L-alanine amidase [Poseidonocella pacifica]